MHDEQSQSKNEKEIASTFFNFQLRPTAEIAHQRDLKEPEVSWFELTDGRYWLNAGGHELLRYSSELLVLRRKENPVAFMVPYVDYYVVRLWEDVLHRIKQWIILPKRGP